MKMSKPLPAIKESAKTPLPSFHIGQGFFVSKKELFSMRPRQGSLGQKKKQWSMDFFSLLQYREYIAGLAVLENSLVYLLYRSAPEGIFPDASSEESFSPGVITGDAIGNQEEYTTALKRLCSTVAERHTSSVILSVLPQHIWMATLEFPKTLDKNSLIEAIDLYFEFSLPFPKEECYIDWEIIDDHNPSGIQYVEVGAVRKQGIDPYLVLLKKEGITAIAVESHLMSVARCLGDGQTLFVIIYSSGAHIGAYSDGLFRFQRFIPWEHIQKEGEDKNKKDIPSALLDEIGNIIHFLRTETHAPFETQRIILVASQDFRDSFTEVIIHDPLSALFKSDGDEIFDLNHVVARGAALRGLLPRKDDTIMSFMAVGTEKIYEWKRAVSFSAFIEKLAIGLSIFFILLYGGSFVLVKTLAARAESRQIAQGIVPQDTIIKVKDEVKRFNQTIDVLSKLTSRSPHWEKLFEEITRLANPGITITSLSADTSSDIVLTGIAANRDALLQFKALVNSSEVFQDIELPFTLLITKENLPFRFSLVLRDNMFLLTP